MRNSLLLLISIVLSVAQTFGQAPCIDDQASINCTAAYIEYDNERARCKEIFIPCMTQAQSQVSMCVSSEFCSDECRSIYFKVLWCNNGTADLVRLEYLDLFCAISSDPQHQDSPNCLDFNVKSKTSGAPEYGFLADCLLETTTNLALPCMETCKTELRSYRNECCSINLAVAKQSIPGEDNEDLINLYSDRLWEHCEVNSPQMCPTPTCPTSTVPTATTTMISVPLATAPSELPGASPKHHMNWFILFITVLFILCNI